MDEINQSLVNELRSENSYLERKCAFLTRQLEKALLSDEYQTDSPQTNINTHDYVQLKTENQQLKRKIEKLQSSVSWLLTKPIRKIKFPLFDRLVKKMFSKS
jgi:chemotaxis protein histidine kinase CheA